MANWQLAISGVWPSGLRRTHGAGKIAGSNPATPTKKTNSYKNSRNEKKEKKTANWLKR